MDERKMAMEALDWCREHDIHKGPPGVVRALVALGYLREVAAQQVAETDASKRLGALDALRGRHCYDGHTDRGVVIVACGHDNCGAILADETECEDALAASGGAA